MIFKLHDSKSVNRCPILRAEHMTNVAIPETNPQAHNEHMK
jgi:hypothetical protein